MKTFLIIIVILGIIQAILYAVIDWEKSMNWEKSVIRGGILLGSGLAMIISGTIALGVYNSTNIPAIDVYRGKTTLQITYKDSIPIDSVVVYKNK